jgi:chemotaxis methyl-accepting protein methylase
MPAQFEALSGPVLNFLSQDRNGEALKVTVMGCSIGAEAYSIASILRNRHPDMAFTVHAYDIDQACIDKAKSARYTSEEVINHEILNNEMLISDFVNDTFDKVDGSYVIKSDIRKHVHFDVADVLDPNLRERVGTSDIVYAQNFLFHLKRKEALQGLINICSLLNPKSALFITGIDPDILVSQTRKHNLIPCDYRAEEIHKEMAMIRQGWPYNYSGCEPFMTVRKDWKRRYSTIFFKS